MNNPWIVRLALVTALIAVAQAAPALVWVVIACCLGYVLFGIVRELGLLPARFDSRKTPKSAEVPISIPTEVYDPWEGLATYMKEKVVGQDAIAETVAKTLWRRLKQPSHDGALGVFCFVGPPGVGKSYFAKRLNERLFGAERQSRFNDYFFFDMTEFASPDAASALFGQPRGMAGSEEYGRLTRALKRYPNCLVLLDEIEKAHADIPRRFLTAWNDGFVTESSTGEKISTAGAIFILTTNAAWREIAELIERYGANESKLLGATRKLLEKHFEPAVLSRLDAIIPFQPLADLDVARVAALEVDRRIERFGFRVAEKGVDPQILMKIILKQKELTDSSARDIIRQVEADLAEELIRAKQRGARMIRLVYNDGQIHVEEVANYNTPSGSFAE
jgi:ATP-dependent Clp protease ATP-binding subunit ClpA